MRYRKSVNKRSGSRKFRRHVSRTKQMNMRAVPMRGGFRI